MARNIYIASSVSKSDKIAFLAWCRLFGGPRLPPEMFSANQKFLARVPQSDRAGAVYTTTIKSAKPKFIVRVPKFKSAVPKTRVV